MGGARHCTPTPFHYHHVRSSWLSEQIHSPCFISTNICTLWLHLFGSLSNLIPYALFVLICSMSCTVSSSCSTTTLVRCTASPACCAASSARCKHTAHCAASPARWANCLLILQLFFLAVRNVQPRLVKCPAWTARYVHTTQPTLFIV